MINPATELAGHESAVKRIVSRFRSRFLRGYIGSKLRTDPIYPAVYSLVRASIEPMMDVGCGIGLLAFYLRERGFPNPVIGVDRDDRKLYEANRIAQGNYRDLEFHQDDVQQQLPAFSGNVAALDLLHYLSPEAQQKLLLRLAKRVAPGALLVLRECPRDSGPRFWATYLAERFSQEISWNVAAPLHFPSRQSIQEKFDPKDFHRETKPLWGRTPFNNHLFIFRRHAVARVSE